MRGSETNNKFHLQRNPLIQHSISMSFVVPVEVEWPTLHPEGRVSDKRKCFLEFSFSPQNSFPSLLEHEFAIDTPLLCYQLPTTPQEWHQQHFTDFKTTNCSSTWTLNELQLAHNSKHPLCDDGGWRRGDESSSRVRQATDGRMESREKEREYRKGGRRRTRKGPFATATIYQLLANWTSLLA